MRKYDCKSCYALPNAQHNLAGRTHYVDDSTLRAFKARVLSSGHSNDGLLFWLVESSSKNFDNTERGFRYVVFDIFGTVLNDRQEWYKSHDKARKAMREDLKTLDALSITQKAIKDFERRTARDIATFRKDLKSC